MFQDLRSFLNVLESYDICHVAASLSPRYEISAAIRHLSAARGEAVIFDRVKGYKVPVVANLLGTPRRMALAMGVTEKEINAVYLERRDHPVKPRMLTAGPCQEVVIPKGLNILGAIPALTHFEKDTGPYFTSAFAVAKDPDTGMRGMGLYRVRIRDEDSIVINLSNPPVSTFWHKAQERRQGLEFALVCGADPLTFVASIVWMPQGVDKFDIAGGLLGSPVELVKCKTIDVEVPAYSEFVLECRMLPDERDVDGPLGEPTGYYITWPENPVAQVQTITHRRNPLYHALLPWGGNEMGGISAMLVSEGRRDILAALPMVRDIRWVGTGVAIVQVEKKSPDDPVKVIDYLLGFQHTKAAIVVDADVDIQNLDDVVWALGSRLQPETKVVFKSGLPGSTIDPSTTRDTAERTEELYMRLTRAAKLGLDVTKPLDKWERFERLAFHPQAVKRVSRLLHGTA